MSTKRTSSSTVEELRAQAFIKKLKTSIKNPKNEETGVSNCFVRVPIQMYCSLAPCYLKSPLQGIQNQHLNPMIMKYQHEVNGVVLGYENLKFEDNFLQDDKETPIFKLTPDTPFAFVWCTCDLLVWCPHVGDVIEGWVFIQSASHIGLLIHDAFNASIKKNNIPESWSFIHNTDDTYNANEDADDSNDVSAQNAEDANNTEEISNDLSSKNDGASQLNSRNTGFMGKRSLGYWVDENGSKIDGKIKFTIRNVYTSGKMISIDGTLLSEEEADSNNHNTNSLNHFSNSKGRNPVDSLPVVSNKKIVFDDEVSQENKESHKDLHLSKMEDTNGEEVVYEANESSSSSDSEDSVDNSDKSSDSD